MSCTLAESSLEQENTDGPRRFLAARGVPSEPSRFLASDIKTRSMTCYPNYWR
jgi:hypothetical protein